MMEYIRNLRRSVGHDCLIMPAAGVFVCKDGQVLLQRRRDNGLWAMHGGAVEIGETVEDAARRELYEETGLIAQGLELLGVFSGEDMLHTYPNGDQVYIIGIDYICREFTGQMLSQTDETLELKWFPLDALPAPSEVTPPDRRPLMALVKAMGDSVS